jgi:hypothetical protein
MLQIHGCGRFAPGVSACEPVADAVVILQFKTAYILSEITDTVQQKMTTAIANLLGVDTRTIALTFFEIEIQGRQLLALKGVMVHVILLGFKGSPSEFASRLTSKDINLQMDAMGLKPVLVMAKTEQANSSGTVASSSSTTTSALPLWEVIGGVIGGGVLFGALAGVAYILLHQKRQEALAVSHINTNFWIVNIFNANMCFADHPQLQH